MDKSLMMGAGADPVEIDYQTYRFGRVKQAFRGPAPDLSRPYVAFIGGTETYGKFVPSPYPARLDDALPVGCANWATPDAGPLFYLKDPVLLEACNQAEVTVIAITHAFHTSNRLFKVFPRRNGQVMEVSEMLMGLYPDVDFREFRFVRPMLRKLWRADAGAFAPLELEIQFAWVARMQELAQSIESPKVLVWLSDRSPRDTPPFLGRHRGIGPAMVTPQMIEEIRPLFEGYVECVVPPEEEDFDRLSRVFTEEERLSAKLYPGEDHHAELAELLFPTIKSILALKSKSSPQTRSMWTRLGL